MRRGDIFIANLNPRSGSEQTGLRPVIIVSHDSFNITSNWNSLIVVPLSTSNSQARRSPTIVLLAKGTSGLEKDSVVLCHQITTLDKSKIQNKIGTLSKEQMQKVEKAIQYALSIFD